MSARFDALSVAAMERSLGQPEEVNLAFIGADLAMAEGLSEEEALAQLQQACLPFGLSAKQVEEAFKLQNDATAWLKAKQGPFATLVEQLGGLFPEIRVVDLVDAVEAADSQVQELIGQLQTLAEAAGLDAEVIEDRLSQIEFDET
jgi:hypothetical protein